MTAGSPTRTPATGTPAFAVDRFVWVSPERLEVSGRWSGVRGVRFVRPTLDVQGASDRRRLLAVLDHKPWAPEEGRTWVAAFPWDGGPVALSGADLAVATDIVVPLGAPTRAGDAPAAPATPPGPPPAPAAPEPRTDERLAAAHEALERSRQEQARLERERDAARAQRDAAVAERDTAVRERLAAGGTPPDQEALLRDLEAVRRERNAALAERDAALRERDAARRDPEPRPDPAPGGAAHIDMLLARVLAVGAIAAFVVLLALVVGAIF